MTQTADLIRQYARELELEDVKVEASLEQPGFYNVTWGENAITIPMDAEWDSIVLALKAASK